MEQLNKIIEFRQAIYDQGVTLTKDAQFELVDALLLNPGIRSFPELSLSPVFRRKWPSVYTAIEDGEQNLAWLEAYFAQQVLPRVWAKAPEVRFQVVGKDPPEVIWQLAADERIQVTGTVDDIRPYLAQATVAVCPALYAVGIQNKVLEAMAMGKPVVCTSAAFASLHAQEGEEVLVAHDPGEFAAHVLQICSNPSLAQRLAMAGRRYVEGHHNWENAAGQLIGVYEQARFEARKEKREKEQSARGSSTG